MYKGPGLPDEAFYRGKAPMTKSEVRAVTLSKMRLCAESNVLDIGAGSGSITIESALIASEGQVWGIERNDEAYGVFLENIKRFGIHNITPIQGLAPENLPDEMFDAIVIGGSGGKMKEIITYAHQHLHEGGRLVVNIVTLENIGKCVDAIKELQFIEFEAIQMQVSRGRGVGALTLMEALNPIYIISATKGK